ncbi:MAG: hypothetical protein IKB34_01060 [Clostridia bacterium]|nr:hypothetical protein [Clostridia bacterium]
MMDENQNEIEIDLKDIFSVLLKRWWSILLVMFLCGAIVFGFVYVTHVPMYESTAKMYVNNDSDKQGTSVTQSDIQAAKQLVNTYCQIIESRLTLETVIKEANLPYTYEELLDMISCGSVNATEIFYITVESTDPAESKLITNTIVKVLPQKITDVVEGSSVRVVDEAVDGKELSSRILFKTALGLFAGLVISAVFFFVYDVLINDTLQSEDWVLDAFKQDIPLLAVIPDVNQSSGKRYGRYKYYRRSDYESTTENKD